MSDSGVTASDWIRVAHDVHNSLTDALNIMSVWPPLSPTAKRLRERILKSRDICCDLLLQAGLGVQIESKPEIAKRWTRDDIKWDGSIFPYDLAAERQTDRRKWTHLYGAPGYDATIDVQMRDDSGKQDPFADITLDDTAIPNISHQ